MTDWDANVIKLDGALHRMQRRDSVGELILLLVVAALLIPLGLYYLIKGSSWGLYLLGAGGLIVGGMAVIALLKALTMYSKYRRLPDSENARSVPSQKYIEAVRASGLVEKVLAGQVTGKEIEPLINMAQTVLIRNAEGEDIQVDWGKIAQNCKWYVTRRGMRQSTLQVLVLIAAVVTVICYAIVSGITHQWMTHQSGYIAFIPLLFVGLNKVLLQDADQYTQAFRAVIREQAATVSSRQSS